MGTARAVLLAVHVATGVPASDLGVSIFLIKGRFLPRLRRMHSERLLGTPAPSPIVWTRGKGIIGICWNRGDTRAMCVDLRTLSRRYQSEAPTPEEFPTLQATGLTMGLTCDEFGTMINKYGEVLAVRIVENSGELSASWLSMWPPATTLRMKDATPFCASRTWERFCTRAREILVVGWLIAHSVLIDTEPDGGARWRR